MANTRENVTVKGGATDSAILRRKFATIVGAGDYASGKVVEQLREQVKAAADGVTATSTRIMALKNNLKAIGGATASAAIVLAHRIIMDVAAKSGATASAQDIIHTVEKEVAASGDTASVKVIQTLKEQVSAASGATASATIITHLRQLVTAESGAVAAEQAIKRLHLAEQAEAGGTAMATLAECLKFAVQVSAGANAGATWTFGTSIKHLVFAVMACEGSAERSVGYFDDNIIFINVDTTTLIPHQHHHHEQCLWPDIVVEFEVDDLPQGFEYEEVSSGASAGAEVIVN